MNTFFRSLFVSVFFVSHSLTASAQNPKRIREKGEYYHRVTNTLFPVSFEGFTRESIFAFDRENTNICAKYRSANGGTEVSIYVYPAPVAMEMRLRDEYFTILREIATNMGKMINVVHKPLKIEKDGYSVWGLSGHFNTRKTATQYTLFECGRYFLKYRLISDDLDSSGILAVNAKLSEIFAPAEIVKAVPLKLGVSVHIAPGMVRDSVLRHIVIEGAFTKVKWVYEKVDSLERCSGFPGLYLEEQALTVSAMVDKWKSIQHVVDTSKERDFIELAKIKDSGFLNEYLVYNYSGLLYYTDNVKLNFEGYEEWIKRNKVNVSVSGPTHKYLLGYEESYK